MRVERLEAARVRDVPHAQRLVVGRREQVAAARVPRRAAHPVVVPHQRGQALARAHVPDLRRKHIVRYKYNYRFKLKPRDIFSRYTLYKKI